MNRTAEKEERVQAIIRMSPESYAAIKSAARRAKVSFNTFAVNTLIQAAEPQQVRLPLCDLEPDPVLTALAVDSFGLSPDDLAQNPRIAKLLAE